MSATGGNRNSKNLPSDADGREWSTDLFGCGDDIITCTFTSLTVRFFLLKDKLIVVQSWFCPCITYGQNQQRLRHLQEHGTPDPQRDILFNDDVLIGAGARCCALNWVLEVCLSSILSLEDLTECFGVK